MKYRLLKEHIREQRMEYLKFGVEAPMYSKVHWMSTDPFVNLFVCQLMKKGKKYKSFSVLSKVFRLIKKWTSLPPLLVFKSALLNMRLFLDVRVKKSGRMETVIPMVLNHKQSILRPMKYLIRTALNTPSLSGNTGVSGQLALAILNIFLGVGPVHSYIYNKYVKIAKSQNLLSSEFVEESSIGDQASLLELHNTFKFL